MRQSWTDDRLDDFRVEVNRRFDETAAEMNRRFDETAAEMDRRFAEAAAENNRRFDEVHREQRALRAEMRSGFAEINQTMMRFGFGAIVTFVVGFAGMIATQL